MSNILVVLQLLLQGAAQLQQLTQLLQTAQTEGRDITDAELDGVVAGYTQAHAALDAAIAAKGTS